MIDLSIVIVNWNARRFLLPCLQSVRDTLGALRAELIVVDNASTDGSVEAVQDRFPGTVLVENRENLGFARANNIGIRASRGRYLCLVNSDVVVGEGCFHLLLAYMEAHPRVGMAGPRMLGPLGEPRRSTMSFPSLGNNLSRALALDSFFPGSRRFGAFLMAWQRFTRAREVDVLNGFFWCIRREALETVGLLDESFFLYGEDLDLCKRFAQGGWARIYLPDAAAIHFGGASSARQPVRFFLEMQRANLRYWRKHHGRQGARAYARVLALHHALRYLAYSLRCALAAPPCEGTRFKMKRSRAALVWLASNAREGAGP